MMHPNEELRELENERSLLTAELADLKKSSSTVGTSSERIIGFVEQRAIDDTFMNVDVERDKNMFQTSPGGGNQASGCNCSIS
mmetsp:Transcript_65759/g.77302  ORF Transcript_65759/g.77302 Transcript_65759/m.77302 type:complete len:83 (-) Transcript_65759:305-553(-)